MNEATITNITKDAFNISIEYSVNGVSNVVSYPITELNDELIKRIKYDIKETLDEKKKQEREFTAFQNKYIGLTIK